MRNIFGFAAPEPRIVAWIAAVSLAPLMVAGTANAQWGDPESGDTGQWNPPPDQPPPDQPPPQQPPPQQPPNWQQPQQPPPQQNQQWYQNQQNQENQEPERPPGMGGDEPSGPEPETDHDAVVGSIGVTFFNTTNVNISPVVPSAPGAPDLEQSRVGLRTTFIGIRYWLSEGIGLDVGLGLGFGDLATNADGMLAGGLDSQLAIGVHAGLPVSLKAMKHFNVLLVPEFSFAYGKATLQAADPNLDADLSGIQLDIGARFGGEIQFGFWGLPNLSLQATIGLGIRFENAETQTVLTGATVDSSVWSIRTIANDVFNGTIRAVYYF